MSIGPDKFNRDKAIDPAALDIECLRQPRLMYEYAKEEIEAESEADRLEHEVDRIEAKLQLDCRNDPQKWELRTETEAAFKAAVKASARYNEVVTKAREGKKALLLARAARASISTKESMLRELIKLHGMQYFAGPSVPHDLSELWRNANADRQHKNLDRQRAGARRVTVRED